MDMAKTMDLTRLCKQINNTVVFFQSYTEHTYKEIQRKNHANSKPKVHQVCGVTPCFLRFRTLDIYRRTDRLGQ